MKKFKILSFVLLPMAIGALGGCISAKPDPEPDPGHTHSFPETWMKDENKHWHQCECGEKSGEADHDYGNDNICDICGYEKIIEHVHTYIEHAKVDATCEVAGNEKYYTCECGKIFNENKVEISEIPVISAKGHSYGTWIDEVPADCESDGVKGHYHCDACGKDFDADKKVLSDLVIPASGHLYGAWIEEVAPGCETTGVKGHYHCSLCNKDFDADKKELNDIVLPAVGHSYGTWIDEVPAGCTNSGVKGHYHCDVCGKDFDADKKVLSDLEIPASAHSYGTWIVEVAPGCETPGVKGHYHCSSCGKDFDADKKELINLAIPATGHLYGNWIQEVAPGCETPGVKAHFHCSLCNKDFDAYLNELSSLSIPPVGHSYGNWIEEVPAGCLSNGIKGHYHCNVCGKDFDADKKVLSNLLIPATGHSYGTWIQEVAPGCETAGVKGHFHCSLCNKDFDAYLNELSSLSIPPVGHSYGNWIEEVPAGCLSNGIKGHYHCNACGKDFDADKKVLSDLVIPATGHSYGNWIQEVAPGCETAGIKGHFHCSLCNKDFDDHSNELSSLVIPPVGHSFENVWTSDENQHWHAATCEHTNLKDSVGNHVDVDQDGKCDVCSHSVYVAPAVKLITISGGKNELDIDFSIELIAEVLAVGGASTDVLWSINNDNAILSDASKNRITVTGAKEGKTVVTATSAFDDTKFASIEITIVYRGFHPSWIEYGFTYSSEFPVDEIREFLGEGEYEIYAPTTTVGGGFYYQVLSEDETDGPCILVLADGVIDNAYLMQLINSGITRVCLTSFDFYEAVDQTGKYTLLFSSYLDNELGQYVSPTMFYFYRSEDAWASSTLTSDTTWDFEKIVNEDEGEIARAKEWLSLIPFVKLGEDYLIQFIQDNSLYYEAIEKLTELGIDLDSLSEKELRNLLEIFGYYGPKEYLVIVDYSIAEPFGSYEQILFDAGFTYIEYEDEEGNMRYYYELADGLIGYQLSYGFNEMGNIIYLELGIATLNEFPINEANEFIENVVGSENKIIAYEETADTKYQAAIYNDSMKITAFDVTLAEAEAYAAKLEALDFEIKYTPSDEYTCPEWIATKGKLVYEFYLEKAFDEETETYIDEGNLIFTIYGDDTKHEDEGIYLPDDIFALVLDGSFDLEPEVIKIDEPEFVVTSSNPEVATVDGLTVTPIADGETTITVSVANTDFTASTILTVSSRSHFDLALEECNEWLALYDVEGPLVLPFPTGGQINSKDDYYYDEYYECYTIYVYGDCDDAAYTSQLEEAGFEIDEDEHGFFATKGDVIVSPWMYDDGILEIDIYYVPESVSALFDFATIDSTSASINGFSFTSSKGTGQSDPAYNMNSKELRLYANNTITFTSEGTITQIFFSANTCGEAKATATFVSASSGSISAVDGGFLWEGNATEVTLTVSGSGQIHINSIEVNGEPSGGGGGGDSSNLSDFADEVSMVLFGEKGVLKYDSDYDECWCAFYLEESSIMDACNRIADLLKEVYNEYQVPTAGTDDEGDYVDALYGEGDYLIYVCTYESEGNIIYQISVYKN